MPDCQGVIVLLNRHCLQFYGAAIAREGTLLICEYCVNGDLFRALHRIQVQEDHLEGQLCWQRRCAALTRAFSNM